MTHYHTPNSTLYGRATNKHTHKELKAYSLETLQKRADLGNADAKQLIKQIKDKSNG